MHSIAEFWSPFPAREGNGPGTVRLFRGAGFCVDAFDVRFGIRVGRFLMKFRSNADAKVNRRGSKSKPMTLEIRQGRQSPSFSLIFVNR